MAAILGIFGICLLFSGVQVSSSALTVDIPQKVYKIASGDDVTIPCKFLPQGASAQVQVTWTAAPDVPGDPAITIVTYFGPTSIKVPTKYKGRVNLLHDIPNGKADLQLLKVTSKDTRSYECKVEVMNNEEDGVSDTANLIVLVAPSPPICKIEGVSEYYQNINLTCRSEEGTPTPTYKWQRYDTTNIARPNPPKTTDINGVLSLYNITVETSGFFICTSTNEIKSATCNLTLAVMPPSMSMASIGGIVGAIVAVALIFGIIIICCYCCRKKEKAEEYRMGTPEGGEFTDKDPEGKGDGQDEHVSYEEERRVKSADRRDPQDDRSERSYDRRSDYTDRRDDHSDRRERYDRDDRYDDRRDRYDDRRDRYDDRKDRYSDRNDRYDDRRDRYDDRRDRDDDSDHYSERYDSRDRPPSVPPNKPKDPRH
ncbi:glycoprotein A33 (transmembrane), paralog a isoform X1 [Ctenopharyngodon idella]|uniref:glycoprotein A33 (transmembrane), paralog a isoform X1 n=1 Tax=Ctenopharyngodon idella TaxID=7959 RepID=UPI00223208DF|nr:glycoprotein A33 (transmembrane), paralog a isoform X1 [Ctenopharyngodon idella]